MFLGKMFLIQILIAIILTNFSFGLSSKTAVLRRVPEDCSDLISVKIDEIRTKCQNDSRHYVIYGNRSMYVRVEGITKDHFPIVRLYDQPKQLDSITKEYLKNCQILDDYNFNDYTYSLKNQRKVHFFAFNYLWLGCPQSLCLSGNIDAATRLTNGTVYVFRGNYYWDLKSVPYVEKAHKISEWNQNSSQDDDFDHGYFNAIVTNSNFTSFYRNDYQYIWDSGKIVKDFIHLTPSEFQFKMDAAFSVTNDNQSEIYDIRGNDFITDKNPFDVNPIKNIGIPWDRVDAAFGQNKTIYLFKDWYYLKLAENIPIPVQQTLVFKDIYNCPSVLYDKFGGYEAFLSKLGIESGLDANNRSLNETKTVKINKPEEFEGSPIVLFVILMSIIIVIIIFVILRKNAKQF